MERDEVFGAEGALHNRATLSRRPNDEKSGLVPYISLGEGVKKRWFQLLLAAFVLSLLSGFQN